MRRTQPLQCCCSPPTDTCTTGSPLEDHFDAIAVTGELGVAKPDPTIFRHTLDMLGVAPIRVWHIGDS